MDRVHTESWILEKSWHLPSNFPDLEKVWEIEIKTGKMVKSLEFFSELQQVLYKWICFSFWSNHPFDNLESGKKKLLFRKKVWKKFWILDPKICTNPIWRIGVGGNEQQGHRKSKWAANPIGEVTIGTSGQHPHFNCTCHTEEKTWLTWKKKRTKRTMGAFFWENPKTDLWSQIIWILHYQKNGRSEKGSSTINGVSSCSSWGKKTAKWSSRWKQEEKAT